MIHFRIDRIYLIIKVILCQLLFSFFFTGVLSSQVQCLVHNENCMLVYVSKLGEIILKFVTMIAVYLIIGIVLMMFIVVLSLFLGSSSGLFIVSVIYLVLFLNILYLQQIYYLRDVNLVEAFRYNLYLSKGKRLRILLPIIMIALITFFINYALNHFAGMAIGNLQMLGIVTSVTSGIVKTFSTLYTIITENLIYFNVEYMDLKELK